ncbi:MAG: hypothetical protein U1F42_03455 [Candidatus Competibacteraceae bacterium]
MTTRPLEGKKIAVLVESQYIPGEIEAYRYGFGTLGAEVHFMSRLWGNKTLTFVSEIEQASYTPQTLEVSIDFQNVSLDWTTSISTTTPPSSWWRPTIPACGCGIANARLTPATAQIAREALLPGFSGEPCRTGASSRERPATRCGCWRHRRTSWLAAR